jgi:hypothetical protein
MEFDVKEKSSIVTDCGCPLGGIVRCEGVIPKRRPDLNRFKEPRVVSEFFKAGNVHARVEALVKRFVFPSTNPDAASYRSLFHTSSLDNKVLDMTKVIPYYCHCKVRQICRLVKCKVDKSVIAEMMGLMGGRSALKELQQIPGVGPSIARGLVHIGIRRIDDLKGHDPEELYDRANRLAGAVQDCCLLYVFRCAVYFASTRNPVKKKLQWWYWKDSNLSRKENIR